MSDRAVRALALFAAVHSDALDKQRAREASQR